MFQLSGDGSDLVVNPHLHYGGSVFSREVAIAMSRGKTIPEGQILHLGFNSSAQQNVLRVCQTLFCLIDLVILKETACLHGYFVSDV